MRKHTKGLNRRKRAQSQADRTRQRDRRGAITVLAAVLMVLLIGMVAFAVDMGMITNTHVELKRAVDSGALAGAGVLMEGKSNAEAQAYDFVSRNPVAAGTLKESDVDIYLGEWDSDTRKFSVTASSPSAIPLPTAPLPRRAIVRRQLRSAAQSWTDS